LTGQSSRDQQASRNHEDFERRGLAAQVAKLGTTVIEVVSVVLVVVNYLFPGERRKYA
jgi:hypothetical protein